MPLNSDGYGTFDLGRVLQTAEGIKALRREGEDDAIRRQYLQGQVAGQQQQQEQQKVEFDQAQQARQAKFDYLGAKEALAADDPHEAIKQYIPELAKTIESHGPGAFAATPPEQLKAALQQHLHILAQKAGIQTKIEWKDAGDKLIPVDDTGAPVAGIQPINKAASPDSMLSAQTSLRGQDVSAATARRGQDLTAQTAAASQAITARGQDMTADTARTAQGQKLTETQGNAKGFGLRATAANTAIENMLAPKSEGGEGYSPSPLGLFRDQKFTKSSLTNWLASEPGRKYLNLAEGFIAPILRKESGAAISDSEREQAFRLYIPVPGDGPDVLAQKAENRHNALNSLSVQAGPGGIPEQPAAPVADNPRRGVIDRSGGQAPQVDHSALEAEMRRRGLLK